MVRSIDFYRRATTPGSTIKSNFCPILLLPLAGVCLGGFLRLNVDMNDPFLHRSNDSALATLAFTRSEIEGILTRHARREAGNRTPVPGLHLGRIVQPISPCLRMAEACICMVIRGSHGLADGDMAFALDEQAYLLSAVGLPASVEIPTASPTNPYIGLRIDLDLELACQVMADIDIQATDAVLPDSPLALGRIDPTLFDAVVRLVRLIEAPQDVDFMSGLIHREILYRILVSPAGRTLRLIVQINAQRNRVAKAVTWLRNHFRERLKVGRLAEISGMAPSTLYRHFQALTGMSPIQYQKRLRLHEARHLMLESRVDVGTAALAVGYESSTQFVREYRRLFGESPLRDVKALRADSRRRY